MKKEQAAPEVDSFDLQTRVMYLNRLASEMFIWCFPSLAYMYGAPSEDRTNYSGIRDLAC